MHETSSITFTVIINNYNYVSYLPLAVESINQQTFRDFELIIVDDGSTDGSLEYLAGLNPTFTFINAGGIEQARACLLALKQARGRYIYILDADDIANKTLLARAAAVLDQNPSKVQFKMVPIDAGGLPFQQPFPDYPASYDRLAILRDIERHGTYVSPPTSGNIFRRDVLLRVEDIDYDRAIDGVTLLLAPYCGEVISLDAVLAQYRVHSRSHSGHARPTEVATIRRDRARFSSRLNHLAAIIRDQLLVGPIPKSGSYYLFDVDQATLETVLSGKRCSFELSGRFLLRLFRERGLSYYTFRKLVWLAVAAAAPRRMSTKIAVSRRTPWGRKRQKPVF